MPTSSADDSLAGPTLRPMAADNSDLSKFQSCFAANGSPRTESHLSWQYVEPPAGKLFVEVAEDEKTGSLAGIYAVFPSAMKLGPSRVLGAQSLDTLTDAAYRGRGLFVQL